MKHMRTGATNWFFCLLALLNALLSQGKHHEAPFSEGIGPTHGKLFTWRKHNRPSLAKSAVFSWLFPEETASLAAVLFGVYFSHTPFLPPCIFIDVYKPF